MSYVMPEGVDYIYVNVTPDFQIFMTKTCIGTLYISKFGSVMSV